MSIPERCYCRECRAGDAMPDHLQGIPGTWQPKLFSTEGTMIMEDPARAACRERCANVGDPPCYEVDADAGREWTACDDCKRDVGAEVIEPLDPDAVTRPLI